MRMKPEALLPSVLKIAGSAGKILMDHKSQGRPEIVDKTKFVTDADIKSHQFLKHKLTQVSPGVLIRSEEDNEPITETEGWAWIIDPLDGTMNYFYGSASWGVSIALVYQRQTQLAVVYFPEAEKMFGVTQRDLSRPHLKVRRDSILSESQIWIDHTKDGPDKVISVFSKLTRKNLFPQVRLCSTASLIAVASGRIAAYIHPSPKPEDIAAAGLVVEKAGGKVTDFQGKPWTPFSKSIVATNGLLHEDLLLALED